MKRINYGWIFFAWLPLLIREMLSLWWHAFIIVNPILKGYNTLIGLKKMPKLEFCKWFAHRLLKRKRDTKLILNLSIIAINKWNKFEQIFIHQHLEVCKMHFPFKPNNETKKYGFFPFIQPQVSTIYTHAMEQKEGCKQKVFASFTYMCMGHI